MKTSKKKARKKDFAIIDKVRFRNLVHKGRSTGRLPLFHDGQCLERLEHLVRVGYARRVYSENQAIVCAAVVGNLMSFDVMRKHDEPYNADFRDASRFVAVEMRVLWFLKQEPKIDWNIPAARERLYRLLGDRVLDALCTSFKPVPTVAPARPNVGDTAKDARPWFAQREPGSDRSELGPFWLYGLFDEMEFPPREVRHQPLAALPPQRRRRHPRIAPMQQLAFRWAEPRRAESQPITLRSAS